MKISNILIWLSALIVVLALIAAGIGLFYQDGRGNMQTLPAKILIAALGLSAILAAGCGGGQATAPATAPTVLSGATPTVVQPTAAAPTTAPATVTAVAPTTTAVSPTALLPVTLQDLPRAPDAIEAKPAELHLADKLDAITREDAILKRALEAGTAEQRTFTLPRTLGTNAINNFYDEFLSARGWTAEPVKSALLENVKEPTDLYMFTVATWTRGNQRLAIVQAASPAYLEMMITLAVITK